MSEGNINRLYEYILHARDIYILHDITVRTVPTYRSQKSSEVTISCIWYNIQYRVRWFHAFSIYSQTDIPRYDNSLDGRKLST